MAKIKCAILGATGMVGREFARILSNHVLFDLVIVAASSKSAGQNYGERIHGNHREITQQSILDLEIMDIYDIETISQKVDFVFSAFDLSNEKTIKIEEAYAKNEVVVVSNNSATRHFSDVPMIVPEINSDHLDILSVQRKRLGTKYGCIVVKPNCAAQSFMVLIDIFNSYENYIDFLNVSLKQAVSGSGKYLSEFKEIDGTILALPDEAYKSIVEPKKIFGKIIKDKIVSDNELNIIADSYRVGVEHGHTASITFKLAFNESVDDIKTFFKNYNPLQKYSLPSSPNYVITYLGDGVYPNPKEHVDIKFGMGFTFGALKYDKYSDTYQITGLTHNLVRGAAGGAVLTAELMVAKKIIKRIWDFLKFFIFYS